MFRALRGHHVALLVSGALALAVANGCGGNDTAASTGTTGTGGGGGGAPVEACPGAPKTDGCTVGVKASADDYTAIETALGNAKAGDTICLCPGTFSLTRELSLATENITVRGAGAQASDVVLDFKNQTSGDNGFSVTGNGFDVENLTLKNTPGNGIVVTGATGVTFRDMKVFWDAGSSTKNGAYAVYPVKSKQVLIENLEVIGAADAGVYVGQCTDAIVRKNKVHGCVAGIESENTTNMEAYDNEAYDNTAGILVFALPNLEKKDALETNVHDNDVHDNNRDNFAAMGSTVSNVPSGTGILVLAADHAEIHSNKITNQKTVGLTMVSLKTFALISGSSENDPQTDPYPEFNYIHDNTFMHVGYDPSPPLDVLKMGSNPVEDIVWDGDERTMGVTGHLCLGKMNTATFRDVNGIANIGVPANQSTDPTPYECNGTVLPPVKF